MAGYIYPGQCITLGFRVRLLMRAIAPIVLLVAIPVGRVAFVYGKRAVQKIVQSKMVQAKIVQAKGWFRPNDGEGHTGPPVVVADRSPLIDADTDTDLMSRKPLIDALFLAVPFALEISFLLVTTVSKGIFDTWDCSEYELDSATGEVRTFLNADLQIICTGNDHPEEYDEIRYIAYFFLALWPIGMPIIYMIVLFPIRALLRQRKSTRWVRATDFLHKDYKPAFFWWEIITLSQRLVLSGFVLLIPIEADSWRIFLGVLWTIGYLSLIQYVQPYKNNGLNQLAVATQFSLVCVFLGGAFIKLFSGDGVDSTTCDDAEDASETNEDNIFIIVVIMAVFNFAVLLLYGFLAAKQFSSASSVLPSIRLVANGRVPELKLEKRHRYHLFLSHVWSSGQDQMATLKRELQLLIYGVNVFLDVDDLEDIGQLDKCE